MDVEIPDSYLKFYQKGSGIIQSEELGFVVKYWH